MQAMRASLEECFQALENSLVVEFDAQTASVRKRMQISNELQLLGFTKQGIEDMDQRRYEDFKEIQKQSEDFIIKTSQIYVTSCAYSQKAVIR